LGAPQARIGPDEFAGRLVAMCVDARIQALPARARDQEIWLKAASLELAPESQLSEHGVDERLRAWLLELWPGLNVDHITLRRMLVDHGYLMRDPAGTRYERRSVAHFGEGVDTCDVRAHVKKAMEERSRRKAAHGRKISRETGTRRKRW